MEILFKNLNHCDWLDGGLLCRDDSHVSGGAMSEKRKTDRRKPVENGQRESDRIPEIYLYDRRKGYRSKILEKYPIDLDAMGAEQSSLEKIRGENGMK